MSRPGGQSAYIVHSPGGLARLSGKLLVYPTIVGVAAGVLRGDWWLLPVALVAVGVVSLSSLRAAWTRLHVGPDGISVSFDRGARVGASFLLPGAERRFVSWAWVHRVEVDTDRQVVRVVVRADAPLPPWVHGRIVDPSSP